MRQSIWHCFLIVFYVSPLGAQRLIYCNFDNSVAGDTCFSPAGGSGMLFADRVPSSGPSPPTAPLSDVTAALKPTTNGQLCNLPQSISGFAQPIYFCYSNFCPTHLNPTTSCIQGRFAHYNVGTLKNYTFVLNGNTAINAMNEQCLTYYYYLPTITGVVQHIQVTKQESDGTSSVIEYVRGSPYNGWIRRQIDYSVAQRGYKIYFDLIKLAGPMSPVTIVAFDEISIEQGRCSDPSLMTATISSTMTTTVSGTLTTTSTGGATLTPTSTTDMMMISTSTSTTSTSTLSATHSSTTRTTGQISVSSSAQSTTSSTVLTNVSSTSQTSYIVVSQSTETSTNVSTTGTSSISTTTNESSSSSIPLAVGLTLGVLILLVIIGIVVYWKCFRRTQVAIENIELEPAR